MKINEQAREELFAEINGLSDEDLNKKPAANGWSIKQVTEHIYLMEGAIAKTVQDQLVNGDKVNANDKPIELTKNRDQKVEAPDFARPSDDFKTLEELKQKLAFTHKSLEDIAEHADETLLSEKGYPHPVFGQMSLKQWIPFVGYHEMRHTEQIKEVKTELELK